MRKTRVFIIHSEEDNEILNKLFNEYNDEIYGKTNIQIHFVDSSQGSQLGKDFGELIKKKIRHSRTILAILTTNSKDSAWVNQEIGFAIGIRKNPFPLKEKSLSSKSVGFIHSNINAQQFDNGQKRFLKLNDFFEKKFGKRKKLSRVVKKPLIVLPIKEHNKLPVRRSEPYVI